MQTTLNYYGLEIVCEYDVDLDIYDNTTLELKNVFVEGKNVNALLSEEIFEQIQGMVYDKSR